MRSGLDPPSQIQANKGDSAHVAERYSRDFRAESCAGSVVSLFRLSRRKDELEKSFFVWVGCGGKVVTHLTSSFLRCTRAKSSSGSSVKSHLEMDSV